ncbi:Tat proofreading chaperone DmsD [Peptococcaceae bacterium CEB3]|nr:Tat proofreading chaperone DmsD [Peptococcaceae bacterium CEB3]
MALETVSTDITAGGEELERLQMLRDLFAAAPDEEQLRRLAQRAEHDQTFQPLAQRAREETGGILAAEWMRLFEGPGRFPVVLFGSYYLDGGKLMEASTLAVRQYYRQHGMEPVANIPADHLAYELGFLGFLTASADVAADATGREESLAARSEFLYRFMLPWMTKMVRVLRESTTIPFFLTLGDLLLSVLQGMEQKTRGVQAFRAER